MLSGRQIVEYGMVTNAEPEKISVVNGRPVPSFGTDGCLYTFRADVDWEYWRMTPGSTLYLKTYETVNIPTYMAGYFWPKSTYTRQFLIAAYSPIDPGYIGNLFLYYFNASKQDVIVDGHGGIAQMTVHRLEEEAKPYAGRWM